ncbi:MAG: molybdenum cofactor guanylyltransferase [Acidimicrobiales bacterium]
MNFSGIVLNGGSSSRMGSDKGEIVYKGRRLIDIAIESLIAAEVKDVIIVGGEKKIHSLKTNIQYCEDLFPNEGPLGGVITGLRNIKSDIAVILACDYLEIDSSVVLECVSKLNARSMVFPLYQGKEQYLFSAIRTECVEALELQFMKGVRSIHEAVTCLDCVTYESAYPKKLRSANTPSQLNDD